MFFCEFGLRRFRSSGLRADSFEEIGVVLLGVKLKFLFGYVGFVGRWLYDKMGVRCRLGRGVRGLEFCVRWRRKEFFLLGVYVLIFLMFRERIKELNLCGFFGRRGRRNFSCELYRVSMF